MDKFRGKYRIPSARASWWDYARDAAYFITICTKNRLHFFGKIRNKIMLSSEIGMLVETEWLKTPLLRPDMNITLGEYQVMPNHFHGIIVIGKNKYNQNDGGYSTIDNPGDDPGRDALQCVSTIRNTTGDNTDPPSHKNKFGPQRKNLGSVIGGFKSAVTTDARLIIPSFGWQARFHDHIIRDEDEYRRIANYIRKNPENWKNDDFYNSNK